MTTTSVDTFADLQERLGHVPDERILMNPPPGTATEEDALTHLEAPNKRLVELVDGVLVEKPMGTRESLLAGVLFHHLYIYARKKKLGKVLPADGALRLMPNLVRIPDVSFLRWERIPEGIPKKGFADSIPNLAVEVLSEGNTKREMQRKLKEYFLSGVDIVWFIDPKSETATVYRGPDRKKRVPRNGVLDGEGILPGFSLALIELFEEAYESEPES